MTEYKLGYIDKHKADVAAYIAHLRSAQVYTIPRVADRLQREINRAIFLLDDLIAVEEEIGHQRGVLSEMRERILPPSEDF
jgi:hypothetical protein